MTFMSSKIRQIITEELKSFPSKIIWALFRKHTTLSNSAIINGKLLEFECKLDNFTRVNLDGSYGLGADVIITSCKINGEEITDSYKRDFSSLNPEGKLEKIISNFITNFISRRLKAWDENLDLKIVEFKFN